VLVAGRHRIEAAKSLGWTEIDANAEDIGDDLAEMAMIDENLKRHDLEPAELFVTLARRKVLYEMMFPETKNGGDRKSVRNNCELIDSEPGERFTAATAKVTGKSDLSVSRRDRYRVSQHAVEVHQPCASSPLRSSRQASWL
jgi:ParB family chromosome partitioning protein